MSISPRIAGWFASLAVATAVVTSTHHAAAQGCCASGASLTPIRLDLHERALAGLQVSANVQHGSFDDSGDYRPIPDDVSDVELRQTAFVTIAPVSRLQVSTLLPLVETRRAAAGAPSEWGVGIGDVSFAARYEPVQLRDYASVPGIALLANVVTPTGTAPEAATRALGSDATGAGVWRLGAGLAVERDYDAFLFNLTALASTALPRHASGVRFSYAPRLDVLLGVGYAVTHYWHTAVVLNYEHEGAPEVDGHTGQSRRRLDANLLVTHLLDDNLRVQAGIIASPPISALGRNDIARVGANAALVWSWF